MATEGSLIEVEATAIAPEPKPISAAGTPPATPSTRIMVTSILRARSNMERALLKQLTHRVEIARREPGCINYDVYQSGDDPSLFLLHENWDNQAALDQHFRTPDHEAWTAVRDKYVADRHVYFWHAAN